MAAATISVDEFQALEQKVLQTVELIKKERELRAAAELRAHQMECGCDGRGSGAEGKAFGEP